MRIIASDRDRARQAKGPPLFYSSPKRSVPWHSPRADLYPCVCMFACVCVCFACACVSQTIKPTQAHDKKVTKVHDYLASIPRMAPHTRRHTLCCRRRMRSGTSADVCGLKRITTSFTDTWLSRMAPCWECC